MPKWAGKWKGGRYYLDQQGRTVYFIERRGRSVRLKTHDPDLALGELARFLADPVAFCRPPPEPTGPLAPVYITTERLNLYLQSIRKAVPDHRNARRSYLLNWADYRDAQGHALDLRTVDKKTLRQALASFEGGFRGRVEALNAFARFLVKERDQGLPSWAPLVNPYDTEPTRAERVVYSPDELVSAYARLTGAFRDVFYLRAATGMHQTEIDQLAGARIYEGPLPDKGVGIRVLGDKHTIQGVIQVMHKSRHRHRQSVDKAGIEAALQLRAGVPGRVSVWKAFDPIVPSNLRHTFVTLAGEIGELVSYTAGGVDRARVAQAVGHRAGSTMTADRYEKMQIPPMIRLPIF